MAAACLAPPVAAESLLEVYALALNMDPKFRAVKAEAKASGTVIDQARAGLLPTIKFETEKVTTRQEIINSDNPIYGVGVKTFPTYTRTLSLTQPIFRLDLIQRYNQAESIVQQAQYTVLAAEQDLMLRTVAAYLIVLAAGDSLALATAEREAVGKLLDLTREKRKMGLGTITQLHDAEARFAVTTAREIEARNKLRDARQGLREITGRTIEDVQVLRNDFPLEAPEPAAVEPWIESALTRNLLLQARRAGVEVARKEIDRQRAGHVPNLMMMLSRNRKDAGSTLYGGGSEVDTTDMTFRLTVPIFEGGLTTAVTEEAVYRHQKAQEEFEQEYRSVERAARAAFDGTMNGVNLIQALKQSVVAQQSALEAKSEGYKAGLNTVLPVLDAQRDLYLARRDYAQSRYDYLINRLKLKQTAGTLAETDLVGVASVMQVPAATAPATAPAAAKAVETPRPPVPPSPVTPPPAPEAAAPAPVPDVAAPAPASAVAPPPVADPEAVRREITATVDAWLAAWSQQQVDRYLSHYAADFRTANGRSRQAWESERTRRIARPGRIEVSRDALTIEPVGADRVRVGFRQHFKSADYANSVTKLLVLTRQEGKWLIQQEQPGG